MPEFHETGYGRAFFDGQLPRLIKALETIAVKMDRPSTDDAELLREAVAIIGEADHAAIPVVRITAWLAKARTRVTS